MGFFLILSLAFIAFCFLAIFTIIGLISNFGRAKEFMKFVDFLFWLIVVITIGSEFLWLIGVIDFNSTPTNISVEQEPTEPSEIWKFLTTPVWDMNK